LASLLLGVPLLATPARAADKKVDPRVEARAREHIQKGAAALRAGHYDDAMTEFEAGYAAVPLPGFILNMGHVQRQAGNLAKAYDYYRDYLELDPKSSQRAEVEKTMAEIDGKLAAKASSRAAPATTSPPRPNLALPAAQDDHEEPEGLKALPAKPVVTSSPTPASASASAPTDDGAFYTRWWFWGAVGAVAAAGVVTFLLVGRGNDYTSSGTWGALGQ
jgi:tetratricopeptide (TPR) repeat protein